MMTKSWVSKLLALLIFTSSSSAIAQQLYEIPPVAGQSTVSALQVSGNGEYVVGTSGQYCFRWRIGSSTSEAFLGNTQYPRSSCSEISFDGSVVGGRIYHPSGGEKLALWTNSQLTILNHGYSSSYFVSLSAGGGVQGLYIYAGGNWRAVRSSILGLEFFPYIGSSPASANASGTVFAGGNSRAIRWYQDGLEWAYQDLGTSRPGSPAGARGINWDGSVVLGVDGSSSSNLRAWRWIEGSGITSLGLPSGSPSVDGRAISHDGNTVVGSAYISSQFRWRPVLWRQGVGWINLHSYLPTLGINLTNWELSSATSISGDGRVVLGTGFYNSLEKNWVATLDSEPLPGLPIEAADPNIFSRPFSGNGSLPINTLYTTARDPDSVIDWGAQAMLAAPEVTGAAADGVTRMVLRWPVPGPGVATLRLGNETGDPVAVGRLGIPGSSPAYTFLPGVAAQEVGGQWYVFASYAAPSEFDRNSADNVLSSRGVVVRGQFSPADGSPVIVSEGSINLVRPPLLLLHGWASDATSWNLNLERDSRFITYAHDYGRTSEHSFATNIAEARIGAERLIRMAHARGIAATQVSVVGHSMGGILARLHAGNRQNNYYRRSNLGQGDFYKLISLYTPHYGSPLACVLNDATGWIQSHFSTTGTCLNCGAVADLRSDSAAIQNLPAAYVPSHAIAGVGGSEAIGELLSAGSLLEDVFPQSRLATLLGKIFGVLDQTEPLWQGRHDLVVGEESAYGALSAAARSSVGFALNPDGATPIGIHWGVGRQNVVADQKLLPLLLAPRTASTFAPIPENPDITAPVVCDGEPFIPPPVATSGSLQLSNGGGSFVSGQSVEFTANSNLGFVPEETFLVGPTQLMRLPTLPATVTVPIAEDALGAVNFQVLGRNSAGVLALSNSISLNVAAATPLTGIDVEPGSHAPVGCIGDFMQLRVSGEYEGNIRRDLSKTSTGTTYTLDNPTLASIDSTGRVQALKNGRTRVLVQHGLFTKELDIEVSPTWCLLRRAPGRLISSLKEVQNICTDLPPDEC